MESYKKGIKVCIDPRESKLDPRWRRHFFFYLPPVMQLYTFQTFFRAIPLVKSPVCQSVPLRYSLCAIPVSLLSFCYIQQLEYSNVLIRNPGALVKQQ